MISMFGQIYVPVDQWCAELEGWLWWARGCWIVGFTIVDFAFVCLLVYLAFRLVSWLRRGDSAVAA